MSAFPLQNFTRWKNSKTMYQTIHDNSSVSWTGPSMWGSRNTFKAWLCENGGSHVVIPPLSYATDEKVFVLESKMNKYGNWVWPWVRVGAGGSPGGGGQEATPTSEGNDFGGSPLWVGAQTFTAEKVNFLSGISVCPADLWGRAISILQMGKLRLTEAKSLAQGPKTSKWRRQTSDLGLLPHTLCTFRALLLDQVTSLCTPFSPPPLPPATPFRPALCPGSPWSLILYLPRQ